MAFIPFVVSTASAMSQTMVLNNNLKLKWAIISLSTRIQHPIHRALQTLLKTHSFLCTLGWNFLLSAPWDRHWHVETFAKGERNTIMYMGTRDKYNDKHIIYVTNVEDCLGREVTSEGRAWQLLNYR